MFRPMALALFLAAAPMAGAAQSVQDQVVSQLRDQGFGQIEVNRTLLGRIRVVAVSDTFRREIVFVPSTGVILRDYWEEINGSGGTAPTLVNPNAGSGGNAGSSGANAADEDDDDKDASDDDDDGDDRGDDDRGGDDDEDDGDDDEDDDDEEDDD